MEKTPTEINVFRQRIFNMFFDKKGNPRTLEKSKLYNSTYFRLTYGVQPETLDAVKKQLIHEGLLIETEYSYSPTIKGEKFYKQGGFTPNWIQKILNLIRDNQVTVLTLISILIAIIALFQSE